VVSPRGNPQSSYINGLGRRTAHFHAIDAKSHSGGLTNLPARYRPTETKIAAPAGTGNGDEFGGPYKIHQGRIYRRADDPARQFTWDRITDLSVRMRLEKSPASRLSWALASFLSLEKEDREALVDMLKHSRAFTFAAPSKEAAE
jgi:hypothetical protein